MANVTKLDLILDVAKESKISAKNVKETIECLMDLVEKHLSENKRLEIRGFGSIFMKKRKSKLVRNPRNPTDTKMLPPRWSPVLKYSKELKAFLNRPLSSLVSRTKEYFFVAAYRDYVDSEIQHTTATIGELIEEGARQIILDFSKVRYIYSPGLSELVKLDKRMKELNGGFHVVNIKRGVLEKLESVNLDKALSLFSTREAFLSSRGA